MTLISTEVVVFLIGLTLLVGCQREERPDFGDTLGTAIDFEHLSNDRDPRLLANFIVLALVEENRIVASHVQATRYPAFT
jgi:hypothetical protein